MNIVKIIAGITFIVIRIFWFLNVNKIYIKFAKKKIAKFKAGADLADALN